MKSRHMEMDEKWAEWGSRRRVGNWLALPADMNGDVKGKKGREVKDGRQGGRKRIGIAKGNARTGEVSITVREEYQRLMV